jgi:hypothetical protein
MHLRAPAHAGRSKVQSVRSGSWGKGIVVEHSNFNFNPVSEVEKMFNLKCRLTN